MTISLEELRNITSLLFKHLEQTRQTHFVIDEEYYWAVPEDKRYNQYEEPGRQTVGQLSEDMDMLRHIMAGREAAVGRALIWLAAILQVLGMHSRLTKRARWAVVGFEWSEMWVTAGCLDRGTTSMADTGLIESL